MKSRIAIFRHDPEASQDCVDGMVEALSGDFSIVTFDETEYAQAITDADIVAFPGGIGDAARYYDFFRRRDGNEIEDFISRGGNISESVWALTGLDQITLTCSTALVPFNTSSVKEQT